MSTRLVIRENRGPVAVLTLEPPRAAQRLSRALLAQLRDAVDELGVDLRVRAVVLTGAGAAFSAGMDLKEAADDARGAPTANTRWSPSRRNSPTCSSASTPCPSR